MKNEVVGTFAGGIFVGLALGYVIGEARARARRAWRDFKATKDSIRNLFHLATSETWRAFKAGLIVAVILGVVGWIVFTNLT